MWSALKTGCHLNACSLPCSHSPQDAYSVTQITENNQFWYVIFFKFSPTQCGSKPTENNVDSWSVHAGQGSTGALYMYLEEPTMSNPTTCSRVRQCFVCKKVDSACYIHPAWWLPPEDNWRLHEISDWHSSSLWWASARLNPRNISVLRTRWGWVVYIC